MLKRLLGLTIGVIFVGAVASSHAGDFYGGAGYGHYDYSLNGVVEGIEGDLMYKDGDLNATGSTLSVFAGYDLNPYLSFEIEHMMHGGDSDRDALEDEEILEDTEVWKATSKGTDTVFWVVPTLPINDNWSLYGAIGYGYYDYELNITHSESEGGELIDRGSHDLTGSSFYSGAGIKWEGEHWGARMEVLNQESLGTEIMSLGFVYNF